MAKTITKGLIGVQDLALGAAASTFSRASSTGGTVTLNNISAGIQNLSWTSFLSSGSNPAQSYSRLQLPGPNALGISRIIAYAAVAESGVGTHCTIAIKGSDSNTYGTLTLASGTLMNDSGALSITVPNTVTWLELTISTPSSGGVPASFINVVVEF